MFVKKLKLEFVQYVGVGIVSTVVDWGIFYVSTQWIRLPFQFSFFLALGNGTLSHYFLNKRFTFTKPPKSYKKQMTLYLAVVGLSFFLSSLFMNIGVLSLHFPLMMARISTTIVMLGINFLLHRYISFNRNWV